MLFSRNAAIAFAAAVFVSFSILSLGSVSPASGAQWLTNGSFEEGTAGWDTSAAGPGCAPRSGSGVAGVAVNDDGAVVNQTINATLAPGTYRFSGFGRVASGESASLTATIRPLDSPLSKNINVTLGSSYSAWSVEIDIELAIPGVRVGIALVSPLDTVVCLDDLTLEGPLTAPPPATATETPVPTATLTITPAPDATATPIPTSTIAASTATPIPGTTPAATSTSVPATSTALPPTTSPGPGLRFVNGGFEDATFGWRTNGGEVDAVTSPRRSGGAAGRYLSESESTKWLYQIVAIDPALAYEFQGSVMTEGAVAETYLRISWYSSGDGSGSAVSTDDSNSRVGADSGGFVSLTTGPKLPPAGAKSARLRVMLAPAGGTAGSVYLDDFALLTSTPATVTPTILAATALPGSATQPAGIAGEAAPTAGTPSSGSTSEVAGARSTASSSQAAANQNATSTPRSRPATGPTAIGLQEAITGSEDEAPFWPYLVAAPMAMLLVAGGYFFGKRLKAT